MKRIVVAPRAGRQIGYQLGECMACLQNAGIRNYSARLERYAVFFVADQLFAIAVKALADAGFESRPLPKTDEATTQCSQRFATPTKWSGPFINNVL
jgi:hypothetical protein